MSDDLRPTMRRQRRGRQAGCGASRPRSRDRCSGAGASEDSLTWRTTRRTFVAVGAYAAQDLRDPDGVTRPLLRRGALRLAGSAYNPLRRLGDAYLRLDPPTEVELGGAAMSALGADVEHEERRALLARTSKAAPEDAAADADQASSPAEQPR